MTLLRAVDASVSCTGVASFDDGTLRLAMNHEALTIAEAVQSVARLFPCDEIVIELPRVYPGVRREDPNDLIAIAAVAGAYGTLGKRVHYVNPSTWKGNRTKKAIEDLVRERLRPEEQLAFETAIATYGKKAHNAIEAIGLGLYYLGRWPR